MAQRNFTSGQKKTVETLDKPLFVSAGAGSGKTYTLTQRVVWALQPGSGKDGKPYIDSLDQALIITFTNEAAKEIKERVRIALEEEALHVEALKVDDAWISTIHGMCGRILKNHALDLDLDPEFKIIDEMTRRQLVTISIEEVLQCLATNPAYEDFLSHYSSFGKAESLRKCIEEFMGCAQASTQGVDAILIMDGEKDCAILEQELHTLCSDFEVFIAALSSEKQTEKEIATEALSQLLGILQRHASMTKEDFKSIPWDTLENALKQVRATGAIATPKKEAYFQLKYCKTLHELISEAAYAQCLKDVTAQVFNVFTNKKQQYGGLDNDDLLHLTAKTFDKHPEIAQIYSRKFKLVMVDEFQDTDQQQVRMIKSLSGENAQYLTTVGDAQQSIYRFRGADVDVFLRRQSEVPSDQQPQLNDNFRSHNEILRFVAKVCGAEGMIPNFMDLCAGREEPDTPYISHGPRVFVEATKFIKTGRNSKPGDKDSRHQVMCEQLAQRIYSLVQHNGVQPKDVAILMSSVKEAQPYIDALQALGIESVVSGASTFGQQPEVQLVGNLLYVVANMYDSYQGLFPVLSSEIFNLDASDLLLLGTNFDENEPRITNRDIAESFVSDSFNPPYKKSQKLIRALEILKEAINTIQSTNIKVVLQKIIIDSGWISRLQNGGNAGHSKIANIFAALDQVDALQRELSVGVSSLAEVFMEWCDTAKESPKVLHESNQNAVTFMTIHASKGLEFPVVAVVGATKKSDKGVGTHPILSHKEGEFYRVVFSDTSKQFNKLFDDAHEAPCNEDECKTLLDWRSFLEAQEELVEEQEMIRRLYVALTRAKEVVILTTELEETKNSIGPNYSVKIMKTLFDEIPSEAGEHAFEYGGEQVGCMRMVVGSGKKDEPIILEGFESELQPSITQISKDGLSDPETFDLYQKSHLSISQEQFINIRGDFFSYSSAHNLLAKRFYGSHKISESELEKIKEAYVSDNTSKKISDEIAVSFSDEDVVPTDFGTVFHELAQLMVEIQSEVDEQTIRRMCLKNSVPQTAVPRVIQALTLWSNSDIRKEALTHDIVVAESPFVLEVNTEFGTYVEGAIDLLAYNRGSNKALVVDYKTGDKGKSSEEIYDNHLMQANFYAYVLMQRGFTSVECAFVCVEVEDGFGQPHVARYTFDEQHKPKL